LRYCLPERALVDDQLVHEELKRLLDNPSADQPPSITGVNTLAGRIVLRLLKRNMQQQARTIMDNLIKANDETRQQLRTNPVGAAS
jgi:hypothetical protein